MITFKDFKRLIRPIANRIFLSLGRGIVRAINNTEGTQKLQISVLAGETITDIERFQEYGFETYPFTNSENIAAFLNGNRDHGIVLCVHDRRYRPKNLTQGEILNSNIFSASDLVTSVPLVNSMIAMPLSLAYLAMVK